MKKNIIVIAAALLACIATSCKNEDFLYQDVARIRVGSDVSLTRGSDSISYSFVSYNKSITSDTINVYAYLIGKTENFDREVKLEVDGAKSTATSVHYVLPTTYILKANSNVVTIPLKINRTADLASKSVRLYLKVAESKDFKIGANEQNHLKIVWSDVLQKPNNWDTNLIEFFGDYSLAKHRLIIDATGIADFNYGDSYGPNWSDMTNYKRLAVALLLRYNTENPANLLKDENGVLVVFPN
jgi:hypothetical protein